MTDLWKGTVTFTLTRKMRTPKKMTVVVRAKDVHKAIEKIAKFACTQHPNWRFTINKIDHNKVL